MNEARNIPANSPDAGRPSGFRTHGNTSGRSPAKRGNGSSFRVVIAARTSKNVKVETGIATEATWLPENRQFTRSLAHSHATGSLPDPLLELLENHSVDQSPGVVRVHPQPTRHVRRPASGNEPLPGRVAEVIWTEALPSNLPSPPVTRLDHRRSGILRRVEKARNLLLNPHYSIQEIAVELGFVSPDVFSRTFARLIGESPRAYRSRLDGPAPADER